MRTSLKTDTGESTSSDRRTRVACVAGGAGFLGSHLCASLIDRGYAVVCLDNFGSGRAANVATLRPSGQFRLIEHDIVDALPQDLPVFDEIYNLACPGSPVHYQLDPVRTAMACAWGTMTLLERAKRDGARMLQASSSEIYGEPMVHPQPESYRGNVTTIGPRACYEEGKRFAETLCTDFARTYGIPVKIARIFNTYGPRMREDDGRVVSNFVIQALKGRNLTVHGDGEQTRAFCYVDDLVAGFHALMASPDDVRAPVNLGNPAEISVRELASIVIALTGSRSRIEFKARPVDDPSRRCPDIAFARSALGWTPRTDLLSGLERTVGYFAAAMPRATGAADSSLPSPTSVPA